jgi:hypothetical protein
MIVTKAVAAITMTSLGSLAAGTAAYFEANPRALTHETPSARPPPPVVERPAPVVVAERPAPAAITIEPVVITTSPRRSPKALAKPSRPAQGPCSDWQGMTTGPAGRKVRLLCPH